MILIDKDGRTRFKINDCHSGKDVALPRFREGDIKSVTFSKSERMMAFYVGGDRNPSTLYVYDFASAQLRKLVDSLSPAIDVNDLVESQSVSYTSFDGLEIPAFLWKPHHAAKTNKVPGLIWVHGGPGGQTRKGYSPRLQLLVNHGYAILGVNHRGSAGYGKSFLAADDGKHAREPLRDCVEGKRYLSSLDFIDASKIGIIGASYGGYLVLAAMAFTPNEFACGVDLFGISNWLRMMESFPPYWKPSLELYYRKIGDPRTDQTTLRAISPLFHAHNITKPLMIVQGATDPRVLRAEADDMVAAIKKRNGIIEYLIFDDEGHGITRKANKIIAYQSILEFLDKYLKRIED
jgi:dipeptidyl aminopeptidase/acylaminoacyl peptidase